jgi:hypothetical protein
MSTDTFSDLETRLRSDLPRLADALVGSAGEPTAAHDDVLRLEPHDDGGHGGRRRALVSVLAAAVVLVLLGVALAIRASGDHDAKPVDVGPAPVEAGWAPMATSPLSPREAAVSVWTGTEVIVWGGRVGDMALLDGAAYDPATDTWRMITPNTWGHPGAHAVWTGTEMVVLAKNGGAAYDPATDSWRDLPTLDDGKGSGLLPPVWTGHELLSAAIGTGPNQAITLSAWAIARPGGPWLLGGELNATTGVTSTSDFQTVWTGTELVVWDGGSRGWAYDPATYHWRSLPCAGCLPHSEPDRSIVVTDGGSIFLVSSSHLGTESFLGLSVPRTDPSADSWLGRGDLLEGGRLADGSQVVAAGDGRAVVLSTAMAPTAVDLSTGAWTDTDPGQEVLGGANQSAVWTGDQLVVWGGADGAGQVTASGWRWQPGG